MNASNFCQNWLEREIHSGAALTLNWWFTRVESIKWVFMVFRRRTQYIMRACLSQSSTPQTIIYVTCGMNIENLVHSLLPYFSLSLLINNAAGAEAASSRTGEVRSSPQSSDCTYIKRLLLLNSPPLLPDWEIYHFPLGLLLVELCKEEKYVWASWQNLGRRAALLNHSAKKRLTSHQNSLYFLIMTSHEEALSNNELKHWIYSFLLKQAKVFLYQHFDCWTFLFLWVNL